MTQPAEGVEGASCALPGGSSGREAGARRVSNEVEQSLLRTARVIAVVGLSTDPLKDSHIVAGHMRRNGYRIVPIHPKAEAVLGERAYPSLGALPPDLAGEVDLVNVFRPAAEVPAIVDEALAHLPNLKGVWTQKGIVSEEAAGRARERGVAVVSDRCIRTQHLFGKFVTPPRTGGDGS